MLWILHSACVTSPSSPVPHTEPAGCLVRAQHCGARFRESEEKASGLRHVRFGRASPAVRRVWPRCSPCAGCPSGTGPRAERSGVPEVHGIQPCTQPEVGDTLSPTPRVSTSARLVPCSRGCVAIRRGGCTRFLLSFSAFLTLLIAWWWAEAVECPGLSFWRDTEASASRRSVGLSGVAPADVLG